MTGNPVDCLLPKLLFGIPVNGEGEGEAKGEGERESEVIHVSKQYIHNNSYLHACTAGLDGSTSTCTFQKEE